ncbi:M15 family metallopeptidase [Desulfolutivibrio sp.]|uniref:M15 family metallopeptidase n=1 Tax=Desulfolutivibrio sp. TaxID=2773296 RepID=UPI002F965D4D
MTLPRRFASWAILMAILPCLFVPDTTRAADPAPGPEISALTRAGLVEVTALDPTIRLDMRYATTNNFTGRVVYPSGRCFLRQEAAARLAAVQADLRARGLGLVLYDCYRPFSVQKTFWEATPDKGYVGRPVEEGGKPVSGSKHNRGMAVDAGLVDATGRPLPMPTDFDDFSARASRHFTGGDPTAAANSRLLAEVMARQGFRPISSEWWHFDADGWKACPLLDLPLPPEK